MKIIYNALFILSCIFGVCVNSAEAITIVNNGKSTFTIVLPEKAPASIEAAASELQRDIEQSTGAKLSIQKDTTNITGNIISLGSTRQAAAAGVTINGIADEGFRILTQAGNLYILGPDTAAKIGSETIETSWRSDNMEYQLQPDIPGPQLTKDGGFSNGTANGVYTFLEDYLGVRWLMPGEIGRDVPLKSTFEVPDVDRVEAPAFVSRVMPYLYLARQKTREVEQWGFQQKLGFSFRLNANHYWRNTVPAKLFEKHPDWFPMINGKRNKPANNNYKLETTNPALVKYYANKAIAALKADPHQNTYSLSPTDSRGWSQSPESKALYDPPPPGSTYPSVTPLILQFYRDVANIVAKEYPEGKLAGYIYQDFALPPAKGSMTIPKNITPVITGLGFGYRFYRDEVRKQQENVMREWTTKSGNKNWFYYGMPTLLRNSTGLISTASPDNINFLFKLLRENQIKGVLLYGSPAWAQEAMGNYIQAKMMWNPQLDANQLQHEWLERAYGPAAGAIMEQLYNKMDNGAFADYFRQDPSQHYNIREQMFQEYYAPHYPEMEKLFLKAKAQPMTKIQQQRLQLIEDNIIVLQWRLKNAGYLPADFSSPLTRNNEQVIKLIQSQEDGFPLFPGAIYTAGINKNRSGIPPAKVQLSQEPIPTSKSVSLPNPSRILLYSSRNGDMELQFSNVHPGSTFLSYRITLAADGTDIQSGILYSGENVVINAKAKTAYYLTITPNGIVGPKVKWDLTVPTAVLAQASYQKEVVYLHGTKLAPIYVYMPSSFSQEAHEDANGVTLRSPLTAQEVILKDYPNAKTVQELNNDWRFNPDPQKTGLQQGFAQSDFNDQIWKTVTATDQWQKQGFPEYHGTAWYRKTFDAPPTNDDDPQGVNMQRMLLFFGGVDGDAVIYLNGEKIGEHLLGPNYKGWDEPFVIDISKTMKPGKNTVAVQVTKDAPNLAGGIYNGVSLQMEER